MKGYCADFRRLIALDIEGDLEESERYSVRVHLQQCAECWDVAEDLKEGQTLLKSIRNDIPALPPSLLPELVLSEIDNRYRNTCWQRFALAAMRPAVALVGLVLVICGATGIGVIQDSPEVSPARSFPVVAAQTDTPGTLVVADLPVQPPAKPLKQGSTPVSRPATATPDPEQVTIQFLTDDPSIIIYWLVDEKGD